MAEKKHIYQSETLALPPLTIVLGEVPSPDPAGKHRASRSTNADAVETETRKNVVKLIGHLKNKEK